MREKVFDRGRRVSERCGEGKVAESFRADTTPMKCVQLEPDAVFGYQHHHPSREVLMRMKDELTGLVSRAPSAHHDPDIIDTTRPPSSR